MVETAIDRADDKLTGKRTRALSPPKKQIGTIKSGYFHTDEQKNTLVMWKQQVIQSWIHLVSVKWNY